MINLFNYRPRRSAFPAPKYFRKEKEQKKPIAIVVKDKDTTAIPQGSAEHAEKACLVESDMTPAQKEAGMTNIVVPQLETVEEEGFDPMEDADLTDIPIPLVETVEEEGFDPLEDAKRADNIEQEGVAQARQKPIVETTTAQACKTIYISDEEEERIQAMYMRNDKDIELIELKYNIKIVRNDLIAGVPRKETMAKLKIDRKKYNDLVNTVSMLDNIQYAIPEDPRKVRKLTIGTNGAIVSNSNIKALGLSHIYPINTEAIPVVDPTTGWIMLKPCSA